MINQSRRNLLKSIGYSFALSAVGVSSAITVISNTPSKSHTTKSASSQFEKKISVFQQKNGDTELVTLMNLTDAPISLNKSEPVKLENINSSLIVKVNARLGDDTFTMMPSERLSFTVEKVRMESTNNQTILPDLTVDHLKLSSEHLAFNQKVPVSIFGAMIA